MEKNKITMQNLILKIWSSNRFKNRNHYAKSNFSKKSNVIAMINNYKNYIMLSIILYIYFLAP
jgi:spore cortex formation protein SpoVR/YcgB (stage V sporulation)